MPSKSFYKTLSETIKSKPLNVAWKLYLSTLPDIKWDKWQLDECSKVIHGTGQRICWNWARGSGKTDKSSQMAVFFMLRGKDVYWFASTRKQLSRAQLCWSKNPYVKAVYPKGLKVTPNRTNMHCIGNGNLEMSCLTSMENASGPHPDICFWDEVALIDRKIFDKSLKVLNHDPKSIGIFFSTPVLESVFHDITRMWGESIHTYLDCSWMNHAQIKSEVLPGLEWMWQQENMCVYSSASGAVFPPITYVIEDSSDWPAFKTEKIRQGMDFGGGKPHTGLRISSTEHDIYLLKEDAFKYKYDDDLVQDYCDEYPTEIEIGAANEIMAPNLLRVTKRMFTNDSKYKLIGLLLMKKIHIDKGLTPKTLKDMLKAIWEMTPKGKPKVETGELDYLAALMHAVTETPSGYIQDNNISQLYPKTTGSNYINNLIKRSRKAKF